MKKVYLIRHGLPDFPGGERMCIGRTDLPLSTEGYSQAEKMAASLPQVTAVFASPLGRALQTARAIGLPVTVMEDLREMDAGQWDGLTFREIRQRYPELYAARGRDESLPPPGAEDSGKALARFRSAMEEAGRISPGDFAVVAHGGIIACFLEAVGGEWRKPGYAEVITLCYKDGCFNLEEDNHA